MASSLVEKYLFGFSSSSSKKETETSNALISDSLPLKLGTNKLIINILENHLQGSSNVLIIALEHEISEYLRILGSGNVSGKLRIVDGFSNPFGWKQNNGNSKPNVVSCSHISQLPSLKTIIANQLNEFGEEKQAQSVIFIDSLSTLLAHSPLDAVSRFVMSISQLRAKLICILHEDILSLEELSKLRYLFSTNATLSAPVLNNVSLSISISHKHSNGKITNSVEHFKVGGINPTLLEYIPMRKEREGSSVSEKKKLDPTANLTFNLKLTDEEKSAKDSVMLPYTHHLKKQEEEIGTPDSDEEFEDPDDDLDI